MESRRRFLELLGIGALTPTMTGSMTGSQPPTLPPRIVDAYSIPVKIRTRDALWLEAARHHARKNDNIRPT